MIHHPSKALFPNWTLNLGNKLFHLTVTVTQRMNATPKNLSKLRALIDALEFEYLMKRRELDEIES